jgi:peptidoglycan/xylan/chitin deacetylase (PgdA/CDA1 family)
MATGWKRWVEWGLATGGAAGLARRRVHPSSVILAYHGVVPAGEQVAGEASLQVDQRVFAEHLDTLLETHEVVSLSEVLAPVPGGRPRAAVTFDDAYRGCLTAGAEELEKRGLPYTVMVAPGILDQPCWWDLLAGSDGALPPGVRDEALWRCRGDRGEVLAWAEANGVPIREDLPDYAIPASVEEVLAWAERPGAAVGAHSWNHFNLRALDAETLQADLRRCRDWLDAHFGPEPRWFAYPYGLQDESVRDTCADVFPASVLIEGGLAVRRGDGPENPSTIPRVNVPRGLSVHGLRLRLAGLLGG